jgi:HAD superfamily hydrolase (TIGR01549 family)
MIPVQRKIHGVLFDLDGTLANSKLEFPAMCREAGLPEGTALLEYCTGLGDCEETRNIRKLIEQHEVAGAERAEWIEGADVLVHRLFDAGVPMAIVTRNMRRATEMTVSKLEIPISLLITREDCSPKPDPEGLLFVAAQWGIQADLLAYVGDYKYDMLAARNAGMVAVLKRNSSNGKFAGLANLVISEFDELLPHLVTEL